jgi:hypothetical protein
MAHSSLPDAISGMLGKEGGTIRFLQDGEYTLTATALNARGKATIPFTADHGLPGGRRHL